jgi:hypothetical protein
VTDTARIPVAVVGSGNIGTDLVVKEDGRPQLPFKVEHATAPMRIAIVIDDGGLGLPEVRRGLTRFVETLQGHAEVGVFSTARSEARIADFTPDTQVLVEAIRRLVPIKVGLGDPLGGPLGSLTAELARQFETQVPARPVLLVLTIGRSCQYDSYTAPPLNGSLAQDPAAGRDRDLPPYARGFSQATTGTLGCPYGSVALGSVLGQVQRSGATYVAVSVAHGAAGSGPNDDYVRISGGRIERVLTDAAIPDALAESQTTSLASALATYEHSPRRDGARLRVEAKRPGVIIARRSAWACADTGPHHSGRRRGRQRHGGLHNLDNATCRMRGESNGADSYVDPIATIGWTDAARRAGTRLARTATSTATAAPATSHVFYAAERNAMF